MTKCSALIILLVIAAVFAAEENPIECQCPSNTIKPVCGDDGKTYANADVLKCVNECQKTNIKVSASGPCSCRCPINASLIPTCASNGKSYINPSAITCHNRYNYPPITIVKDGPCKKGNKLWSQ